MYFVRVCYKSYKGSVRANILSLLGGVFKGFLYICLATAIMSLGAIPTAINPNYSEHIKIFIPVVIIIGLIFFIIGGLMQKRAEKVGKIDFKNKIKNDFEFTKIMVKEDPHRKEWYMSQNQEYANYVLSGKEKLEQTLENLGQDKATNIWRNVIGICLLIVFFVGGFYLLSRL